MTTGTSPTDFAKRLDRTAEDTEALLGALLSDALLADEIARPKRLIEAMRYSSLGGGKRLRPFLVVESSDVFGVARKAALLAGAALECIHCYSLIHDDLPAMDNSDLRRRRPFRRPRTGRRRPPAADEDRCAAALWLHRRRDPRPVLAKGVSGARRLRPRTRRSLPDRRRSARCRGRCGGARQNDRTGRRVGQDHFRHPARDRGRQAARARSAGAR